MPPDSADAQLLRWIQRQHTGQPLCLGLCGPQGSGKSTLASHLLAELAKAGMRSVVLSLDDLYLSRTARATLAKTVHPLLATRGVPGTHDVVGGIALLDRLRNAEGEMSLPRFDKARDDPGPPLTVRGPFDLILFEGWCLGLPPQAEVALARPVNALERDEDADGRWRRYVNQQLATDYCALFSHIDKLLYLQAPDWNCVYDWRMAQENETAAAAGQATALSEPAALQRFIAHYERLSRHAMDVLPSRADAVRRIDHDHGVLAQELR